ncbi:MAG: hypothetical protein JXQ27_03490 [Acidobacteria bacterium]|nr:hypothetical protein [Acidobacteriota bacterium]
MKAEKIFPTTYEELEAELGSRMASFNQLFEDAIRYFDSLLGQDARSSPGLEQKYLDRFLLILKEENFLPPRNPREILIKISYGYYMKHQVSDGGE